MSRLKAESVPTYVSLALASGVSGTVQYAVIGGWCYVDIVVAFTSVNQLVSKTVVTTGGLPAALCPTVATGIRRGRASNGAVDVRIDINTDGSIAVVPLSAASSGAVGFAIFPAGL